MEWKWKYTGNGRRCCEWHKSVGAEAEVTTFDSLSPSDAANESVIAFGCPAMGAEVLEEGTVEPFMADYETKCSGKKLPFGVPTVGEMANG